MGWLGKVFGRGGATPADPTRPAATFSTIGWRNFPWWAEQATSLGGTVTREYALTVPSVLRGRNLVCGTVAAQAFRVVDADNRPVRSPLLEQIDPDVPNSVTIAQTVEDLLFKSVSWWRVLARDYAGFPVSARRYDPNVVSSQPPIGMIVAELPSGYVPESVLWVAGEPVPATDMVRFDSPNPPLLQVGARAIRRAAKLAAAAEMYSDEPQMRGYFQAADDADPEQEEIDAQLDLWEAARRKRATGYVSNRFVWNPVQVPSPADYQLALLVEKSNVEIANAFGLDAEDVQVSTTSRTYQNAVDRRQDKINGTFAPLVAALTDRLSMGDITRRGQRVCVSWDRYLEPNPTDRATIAQAYVSAKIVTPDEVRTGDLELPALSPAQKAELNPQPLTAQDNQPSNVVPIRRAANFAADPGLVFDTDVAAAFTVDENRRTITGLVVPWGEVGRSGGARWKFTRDSLRYNKSTVNRIKLLVDHDPAQTVGRVERAWSDEMGMWATFKVARGPEGDRALAQAADGARDGLSVGIGYQGDDAGVTFTADPTEPGVRLVTAAPWRETSLVALPAFGGAHVTAVTMAADQVGASMPCALCGQVHAPGVACPTQPAAPAAQAPAPAQQPTEVAAATYTAAQVAEMFSALRPVPEAEKPAVVNPTALPLPNLSVTEPLPYRFDRGGRFAMAEHEFSTDLVNALKRGDVEGQTEYGRRALAAVKAKFAADPTVTGDVNELSPEIARPDLYVGRQDFRYPIWQSINKGALPNASQPFRFPKRSSSTIAVAAHSEGVEPEGQGIVTTSDVVTPTALSGKASITREVWDLGGNPAISNLIMDEFVQSWNEGLESAAATFLNTLTAATDITLTDATDTGFISKWQAAVVGFNFIRAYNFDNFFANQELFTRFAGLRKKVGATFTADDGVVVSDIYGTESYYPIISPSNANGTSATRFTTIDAEGYTVKPSWALAVGSGAAANSWLYDSRFVHGWVSGPQRLEFPGTDSSGGYAPIAMIDVGVFGYKAFTCRDISAVRQVIYDTTP